MSSDFLRDKTYRMAIEIVRFAQKMISGKEFILSNQLIKSGTSPGALMREAQYAESRADYKHKFAIALKEANEANYWLDLISDTYPIFRAEALETKKITSEVLALLISSTKTLKRET